MSPEDIDLEGGSVERGFVEVGDHRLGYVAAGSGPLMLLHHGFPSCAATFRNEVIEFSDTHRVVAIDGLGANHSSKPADLAAYRIDRLVDLVDGVAQHFGGDEPFTLVGHDWGAVLSWAFAQARPERLRAMVSMAGLPFNQLIHLLQTDDDQRTRSNYMWSMRDGSMHEFMTAADSSRLWRYIHEPLLDLPTFDETMQRETQAAFAVPGAIDAGIDWYRANVPERDQLATAEPWPSADARTAVPVLQIWGEDDGVFSPRFMDELGRYADDVTVLRIPGGRHWPMLEAPAEVHAAVRALLDRVA